MCCFFHLLACVSTVSVTLRHLIWCPTCLRAGLTRVRCMHCVCHLIRRQLHSAAGMAHALLQALGLLRLLEPFFPCPCMCLVPAVHLVLWCNGQEMRLVNLLVPALCPAPFCALKRARQHMRPAPHPEKTPAYLGAYPPSYFACAARSAWRRRRGPARRFQAPASAAPPLRGVLQAASEDGAPPHALCECCAHRPHCQAEGQWTVCLAEWDIGRSWMPSKLEVPTLG